MNFHLAHLNDMDQLLGSTPSRRQVLNASPLRVHRTLQIRVNRNFPFEFNSHLMSPFFALWGARFTVEMSDYDPSLSHIMGEEDADAYIFWLDWRLYRDAMTVEDAVQWLIERIHTLRRESKQPVLVNNWPESNQSGEGLYSPQVGQRGEIRRLNYLLSHAIDSIPDCWIIDLAYLAQELNEPFFDSRNDQISHYPFTNRAAITIARHFGVHLFPALFTPRIKAIALDLDDTLYAGTLGEDGIEGVRLNEQHLHLQHILLRLKHSGMLLTLCTRNEESDVKALFAKKSEMILKWDEFAAVCANWLPKPDNLMTLANKLNIDPSAFLFIDDNPAELLNMGNCLPEVRLLRADPEGGETVSKLSHYPGLYQLRQDDAARLRTADINANETREKLKIHAQDHHAYLTALHMKVTMYLNYLPHTKRLVELSNKTNQFNLALCRFGETAATDFMQLEDTLVLTVQLTDALTDSGIIGAFICQLQGNKAMLLETLFSCRALGRDIETISFYFLLQWLQRQNIQSIDISVTTGPRNSPARKWLSQFVSKDADPVVLKDLIPLVKAACSTHPAKVEVFQ